MTDPARHANRSVGEVGRQAALRARMRQAPDARAASGELARYIVGLGFERCVVLLDERETGVYTVAAAKGYPDREPFANFELHARDVACASLLAASPGQEATSSSVFESLDMARAIAVPLRDAEGALG